MDLLLSFAHFCRYLMLDKHRMIFAKFGDQGDKVCIIATWHTVYVFDTRQTNTHVRLLVLGSQGLERLDVLLFPFLQLIR